MKKTVFAAILLALVFLFFGCFQLPAPEENFAGFKDCDNSEQCITDSLKICEKAFATISSPESTEAKMDMKTVVYGFENENCKVKYKIEKIWVNQNSPNAAQNQAIALMLQGKDMVCMVSKEQLEQANSFSAIFSSGFEDCKGSLADAFKGFMAASATAVSVINNQN